MINSIIKYYENIFTKKLVELMLSVTVGNGSSIFVPLVFILDIA